MALRKVGAYWEKEGKNGPFLSGKLDEALPAGATTFIFPIKEEYQSEGGPKHNMMLVED